MCADVSISLAFIELEPFKYTFTIYTFGPHGI